jgi:sRNA-binding regulator protein Hfq
MNALPKISIYILISLILGLIIDSQSITAEQFNQDFGYFSSGSGAGENSSSEMSVVTGLAVSSEEAENELYKQVGTSSYSFVNTVNRAPIISVQSGFHLSDLIEDPVDNKGNSIDNILDSDSKHAIIDINMGAQRGIAIIEISHLNGQWEYTTDNQKWFLIDDVSEENALLLAAGIISTRVRFVPESDHYGSDNGMLTFRAWDQSSKRENGSFADTRNNGDSYAFSQDAGFVSIFVIEDNDPPIASAGSSYTANEGGIVKLDASQSKDVDDGIAQYIWKQTAGIPIELSDPNSVSPKFQVPEVDTNGAFLSFKLEISDHKGLTAVDTVSIYITNVLKEFQIISQAHEGGTISPDGNTIVMEGSNQVFAIIPMTGYQIADVIVDNVSKGPKDRFTFWDVNKNHTINAIFKEKPSIDASADDNGLIDPSGKIYVNEGDFQLFKISANEGYKIDDVIVNGKSIGAKSSYYFENVTGGNTISATFKPARFSITVQQSENGDIQPSNLVWVTEGKDQTFSIVPSDGYEVASVTIDGQSAGIINTYTFYHVIENHTLSASFRKMPVISASVSGNGRIEPHGNITVNYDSSQAFTMSPSEGYLIKDVLIDGRSIGSNTSYIFNNIQTDHQISVIFSQPVITATAGENGQIEPSGEISVPSNTDQTFTITPIKDHEIDDVLIDGISIGSNSHPTIWDIVEDHTIHAIFKALPIYQITATTNKGGKIESEQGESPLKIVSGGFAQFKIIPDDGFEIEDVLVNGKSQGIITQYLFKDVSENQTIQVVFKQIIIYTITATATEGGQISPSGSIVLQEGDYQLFNIYVNENYRLVNVLVDKKYVGNINSYAFTADQNHTIHAIFEEIIIRSIQGRVIDEDIQVSENQGLTGCWIEVRQDGVFLADTTTDDNGYYTITGLSPESNLIVSAWPPPQNNNYRNQFYNQQSSSETANPLSLTAGNLSRIDFKLPRNYQEGIQGRVHDGNSPAKGIPDVAVDVFSQKATFGKSVMTDEQGYYTIIGLKPENDYRVSVFSTNYDMEFFFALQDDQHLGTPPTFSVFSYDESTPVTPSVPILQNIDIIYNPNQGDRISGRVFTSDGTFAAGINVNAWSEGLQKGNMTTTDDSGQYTITGLERVLIQDVDTKGYIVEIQPENYPYQAYNNVSSIASAEKIATGSKDIDFHLRDGITLRGRVENTEGLSLLNVAVSAWSESEPDLKRAQTLTDETGAYTLPNLPVADDYILAAFPKNYRIQYYNGKDSDDEANRLDLRYNDLSDLNFQLNKGYIITGTIYIEDVPVPANIPVHVWSESTNTGGTVLTDPAGRFEVIGLSETANDYIISVHAEGYPPAFYRDNGDRDSMNDTVYSWDAAEGIRSQRWFESPDRNLNLTKGYTLSGIITYKNNAVPDIRIDAWNSEVGAWGQAISTDNTTRNYTITGLAPGKYRLSIFSDVYADTEIAMTLTAQDKILDIPIQKPERSISGIVVGIEKGSSVRLNAWSTSENTGKVIVLTGDGQIQSYIISGLKAASDYRVEAISYDYYYQVFNQKEDLEFANLVDLSDQNQAEINFTLEKMPQTATVFGNVLFPDDAVSGDRVWIQFQSKSLDISKDVQVIFENANVVNYSISGFLFSNDYIAAARSDTFLNQYYNNADDIENASAINISSDKTDINFELHRGSAISGKIIDETQSPLIKANVEVWSDKTQTGAYAITDEYGIYKIAGLKKSNDYIVWVRDTVRGVFYYAGKKSVRDADKAKTVNTIPKDQSDVDIFVTQTYSIQGRITSVDGQILEGVWVDVKSVSSKKGGGAYTKEDGSYQINGLTIGNDYKITVTPQRPFIGQEKENIAAGDTQVNFVLQSQSGVRLSGVIYSSNGKPLEGAKIEVQSSTDKNNYALVQSESSGAYQIDNLPKSDDYLFNVWPLENSSDAFHSEQSLVLNEDTIKDITLRPALKISGVVTNRDGNALKNIQVSIFSESVNYWKEIKTDKNGGYTFNNVSEATDYIVTASSDDYIKQIKKKISPGIVDFVLEQSGFISGYVRDKSSGKAIADASVEIFSESMKGSEGFGGVATTNNAGFFKVLELKPVDQQGHPLYDYVVSVHANDYPDQSKGGKSIDDSVEFFLSKSVANILSGTVQKSADDIVVIDLFDTESGFLKNLQTDDAGHFTITALSPEKSYQLRFLSQELEVEQWADSNGKGITDSKNAASFKAGDYVNFSFTQQLKRKRGFYSYLWLGMSSDPMSVRDLCSTTHPYVKVTRLRSAVETSGQLSNKPNVTMQWKTPETDAVINGYYSSFSTDSGTSFSKFNTIDKPPIRTRKITSRDLEGDDVNYYFHVASVDKEGRIGDTQSIAFRIDTVPPTNVSVVPPIETSNRSVELVLGATGASEMYISNVSYSEGGTWEIRSAKKTWQLPEGSGTKKIYARYRDRAKNSADASAITVYEEPVIVYTIDAINGENGQLEPNGKIDVEEDQFQTFTIIPDDGYRVDRILIDDKAININELSYTFENVHASHSIDVQFKRITHRISVTVGDNGSVLPASGVFAVPLNENQQITVVPDSGYGIDKVLVDGKTVTLSDNTYTFASVTEDHTFIVTFEKVVSIQATFGDSGKLEPSGNISVPEGGYQSIQIIPDPGYEIDTVTVNNQAVSNIGNIYTFLDLKSNQTIHATFRLTQFIITAISSANGNISPNGTVNVVGGENQQFTFTPNDNYEIDQVLVDDQAVVITNFQYLFSTVTQDHMIAVSFSRINTAPVAKETSVYTDEDVKTTGYMEATDIDGDSLTYQITVPGDLGRIHVVNETTGEFVYTPNPNVSGTDTITFTASDGKKTSNSGIVLVHINAVNDIPTAFNQSVETAISTEVPVTLNAEDKDDDPLQFIIVKRPEKGKLTGNPPYLLYEPLTESRATDSFYFIASDNKSSSYTATVSITIGGPDADIICEEDTPYTYTIQNIQIHETCIITKVPEHGSITAMGRTIIYSPELNFNGYDQFDYTTESMSENETIKVYVRPVNDAPIIAMPMSLTMLEDDTLPISVTVTDVENDTLTISIDQPPNGEIIGTIPDILQYVPMKGFTGADEITVHAMDGFVSTQKTLHITVEAKNVAPVAYAKTWQTSEDQILSAQLIATDANNDSLYFLLTENSSNGKATIVDPNTGAFTYSPNLNFNGTDKFSFKVYDGVLDSDIVDITLEILPVNDPPIAVNGQISMFEDAYLSGKLVGYDPDGNDGAPLTFQIIRQSKLGHANINDSSTGVFIFDAYDNVSGSDSFEFMVIDGENTAYTSVAIMDVFITPVNDAPLVSGTEVFTDENTPVSLTLTVTDIDSDLNQMTYQISEKPEHGLVSLIDNLLVYTPEKKFFGEDTIKFLVSDGELTSNEAKITIYVGVEQKADIYTSEDHAINFSLPAQGYTGTLTFEITTKPQNGKLTGLPTSLTYTPNENFNGDDYLEYTINDGIPYKLTIYVRPENDPPVINIVNRTIELQEDIPLCFTLIASDVDNENLVYRISESPTRGLLIPTETANSFVYSPFVNFNGLDQVYYSVSDGILTTFGRIILNIASVNDSPVAIPETIYTLEERSVAFKLTGTDIESDALIMEIVSYPQHGVLSDAFVYTPVYDYFGKDYLTFRVNDGKDWSEPAVVTIEIENINDPPIVISSTIEVDENGVAYGQLQFKDPDNDILVCKISSQGTKGMAVLSNPVSGDYIYFADVGKTGVDQFEFLVDDSKVTVGGEVQVTIKAPAIEYGTLNISLGGHYTNGNPYEYVLLMSETGKIYREGTNNLAIFSIPAEKGKYRLLIVAKNFQPYEYCLNDSKIIEIGDDPVNISANLLYDAEFDPLEPSVEVTHIYLTNGFDLHVIRKNFNNFNMTIVLPDGSETSVDQNIYTRSASRSGTIDSPYTYRWTTEEHYTEREHDQPGDGDLTYMITFNFYDTETPEAPIYTTTVTYIEYGSTSSQLAHQPKDEKHFEDHYGNIQYISSGESVFYPLLGTTIHILMKDIDGNDIPAEVNIPVIPLDYLFVDDQDILQYDESSDTYEINPGNTRNVASNDKLCVRITNYTFGQNSLGTGVRVKFYLNKTQTPVYYNPYLNASRQRLSDMNKEIPPSISLPILINSDSDEYTPFMAKIVDHQVPVKVNEKGDGIFGFHTERLQYLPSDIFIILQTPHLSSMGLDVDKEAESSSSVDPYAVEAPAGSCFISTAGGSFWLNWFLR